ncbi:MAG: TatD family hydrolase [Flavobacteriales bacterium]
MIVDSHAHIYSEEFDEDFDAMIQRAREAGVNHYLMPNVDVASIERLHRVSDRFPDNAYPMMGLHPCSVKEEDMEDQLGVVERHLFMPVRKYYAVGEIGIDLYWDKSTLDLQIQAFELQINWAKTLQIPIVIHVRDSFEEVLQIVDRLNDDRLTGVFHCFTGTKSQAEHIIEYGGFKLGIGGVATFKNGKIDQFIHEIDLSHLILETDSPYLAPVPHRGKRNEPAYAALVAEKLASCYGISKEEIARITTKNCEELFKIEFTTHETDLHGPIPADFD